MCSLVIVELCASEEGIMDVELGRVLVDVQQNTLMYFNTTISIYPSTTHHQ